MDVIDAANEVLAFQLDIARQSIEERDRKVWELQKRVELLEQLLDRTVAQRSGVPPQPLPAYKPAPKRWAVR